MKAPRKIKQRLIGGVLSFCLLLAVSLSLLSSLTVPAAAIDLPVVEGREAVYLYNVDYDRELFHTPFAEEGAVKDTVIYPASTVKIMTGLLAAEALKDRLEEKITVTHTMLTGVVGNNMALEVGETVKIGDMIYGLLANCANDAAQVLACLVGGSVDGFVKMMNDRAALLRMNQTYYTNPTGMHDDRMVTTLRDLAILAKAAMQNELLMTASSEVKYVMEGTNLTASYRNLYNRNALISTFYNTGRSDYRYSGIRGLNAGYTAQSGYCLVTTATRGGLTYLCIVMNGKETAKGGISSYEIAREMFDWAFASYARTKVLSTDMLIGEIPVTLSSAVDFVKLRVSFPDGSDAAYEYLPTDVNPEEEITYSWNTYETELRAPVKKGTEVGDITVLYNGEILLSAKLVADTDVARSDLLYMLQKIRSFTSTVFFWATLVSIIVLSLLYVLVQATQEERAARRRHTAGVSVNLAAIPRRSAAGKRKAPPTAVRRVPESQRQTGTGGRAAGQRINPAGNNGSGKAPAANNRKAVRSPRRPPDGATPPRPPVNPARRK